MTENPTVQDAAAEEGRESKAEVYRRMAQAFAQQAAQSHSAELREMQLRVSRSYLALAENEEWLDGSAAPQAGPSALGTSGEA